LRHTAEAGDRTHVASKQGERAPPPKSDTHTGSTTVGDRLGEPDGRAVGAEELGAALTNGDRVGDAFGNADGDSVGRDEGASEFPSANVQQPSCAFGAAAAQNVLTLAWQSIEFGFSQLAVQHGESG